MSKNQHGFAVIESLLILIIVATIGGAGWYVWQSNKNATGSLSNAANSESAESVDMKTYGDCIKLKSSTIDKKAFPQTCTTITGKTFTDPEPYAEWKKYESTVGKYTIKYPAAWAADVCDPSATDLTLHLGPTKASRVICNSEHPAQISIVSTAAVPTASEQTMDSEYFKDTTIKEVTVDGVKGKRLSGRLKADLLGVSVDTLLVQYFFLTPGRSYIAAYIHTPKGDYSQDNLKLFDAMIEDTFKISD